MNIDDKLLSIESINVKMNSYLDRISREEYHTSLPYLQYNIPLGELRRLRDDGLFDRDWIEYDPIPVFL